MTLRTTLLGIIIFVLLFCMTTLLFMPVQFVVNQLEGSLPETIRVHSPAGSISNGQVVLTDATGTTSLPLEWNSCFIDILHPIGLCFQFPIRNVQINLALLPWIFGKTVDLYNIIVNADLRQLAQLHTALAPLAVAEGRLITNIAHLSIDIAQQKPLSVQGQIQLANFQAVGLNFGTIDASVQPQEEENGDITLVIALKGGTIEAIETVGSGLLQVDGTLNMRLVMRTQNPEVEEQLAIITQKNTDGDYEYTFNGKVF